jgi:hypothetical protein
MVFSKRVNLVGLWYTGLVPEYERKPNTQCSICSKPIYRRPIQIKQNLGRVFCGQVCYGISCRREKPCSVCGNLILANLHKKTCSRICANKHRIGIKYKLNCPKDKVKNYRSLKLRLLDDRGRCCEKCGYKKYEILEVHHKDRNRENNELINLELICPNCHAEEHFLKNSWFAKKK